MKRSLQQVKALTFDVFGTVVDYRGSIIREMRALAEREGWDVDPAEFADAWRDGYHNRPCIGYARVSCRG